MELKAAFQEIFFTPGNIRTVAASQLAAGRFTQEAALILAHALETDPRR